MKMLGDFNAKVGKEDIFKSTVGNESVHEISNDNRSRVVKFTASKNLTVKSMMFIHCNIHKYTLSSLHGNTHIQIDHTVIDRRRLVYFMFNHPGQQIMIPQSDGGKIEGETISK
jgi:hypothetical protein